MSSIEVKQPSNLTASVRLSYLTYKLNPQYLLWNVVFFSGQIETFGDNFAGLQIYGWPGSLSHNFKIRPITFQGSGPSGPILFSCEKSHFIKKYSSYSESTNSTKQKVHIGNQYSKTCLKQPLKKDKTEILLTNVSLIKVERIAEYSPWSILQYF